MGKIIMLLLGVVSGFALANFISKKSECPICEVCPPPIECEECPPPEECPGGGVQRFLTCSLSASKSRTTQFYEEWTFQIIVSSNDFPLSLTFNFGEGNIYRKAINEVDLMGGNRVDLIWRYPQNGIYTPHLFLVGASGNVSCEDEQTIKVQR